MIHSQTYKFKSKVWLYKSPKAAWHFITVPEDYSAEIKFLSDGFTGGWGSIPVRAIIGKTQWKTSIFPDKKIGCYILPLKAEIRKKESLAENDTVKLELEVGL